MCWDWVHWGVLIDVILTTLASFLSLPSFYNRYANIFISELQAWLGSKATALAWHLGAQALLNMTLGPTPWLWGASASFGYGATT